jgi:SMC interacting uncharacterized protein involved in chromosome segregation
MSKIHVRRTISNKELRELIDDTIKYCNSVKKLRKRVKDTYSAIHITDEDVNTDINEAIETLQLTESRLRRLAFSLCYIYNDMKKKTVIN